MLWAIPLRRYAQFSGRASRAEFWHFVAAVCAATAIAFVVDVLTGASTPQLSALVILGSIIPAYAVTFRRLHDRNVTGWVVGLNWMLNGVWFGVERMLSAIDFALLRAPLVLIQWADIAATLALAAYMLIQVCGRGDRAANQYGPLPRYNEAQTSADAPNGQPVPKLLSPSTDFINRIERLAKLRDAGALNVAEFEAQKAALLSHPTT